MFLTTLLLAATFVAPCAPQDCAPPTDVNQPNQFVVYHQDGSVTLTASDPALPDHEPAADEPIDPALTTSNDPSLPRQQRWLTDFYQASDGVTGRWANLALDPTVNSWVGNREGIRSLSVVTDEDGNISFRLDGSKVDEERIRRDNEAIALLDTEKEPVLRFRYAEDGTVRLPKDTQAFFTYRESPEASKRPMIGINMEPVSDALAYHLDLGEDSGVMITRVIDGMSAAKAGLRKFDVVVAVNGDRNVTMEKITDTVRSSAGKTIDLTVVRRGQQHRLQVEVVATKPKGVVEYSQVPLLGELPLVQHLFRQREAEAYDARNNWVWRTAPDQDALLWSYSVDPKAAAESDEENSIRELQKRIDRLEKVIERLVEKLP